MNKDRNWAITWFTTCWILIIAVFYAGAKIHRQQREIENLTNSNTVLISQCANASKIMEFKAAHK